MISIDDVQSYVEGFSNYVKSFWFFSPSAYAIDCPSKPTFCR